MGSIQAIFVYVWEKKLDAESALKSICFFLLFLILVFEVEILASGKTDYHCKIKETLFIKELNPAVNVNLSCDKLLTL